MGASAARDATRDEAVQGKSSYGQRIGMHALSNSGLRQFTDPALNVDEWRDNYTNAGDFRAVPEL